jgi:hypothetical protein
VNAAKRRADADVHGAQREAERARGEARQRLEAVAQREIEV